MPITKVGNTLFSNICKVFESFGNIDIANTNKPNISIKGFLVSIFVIFFKICIANFVTMLKQHAKAKIQINKNSESNLSKKLPNSIYLATLYKGAISLVF